MKVIGQFIFLMMFAVLTSCNNSEHKEENTHQNEEATTISESTAKFKNLETSLGGQMNQVVQHYIHLKNALVKSDATEAKAGADGIIKAIAEIDSTKLSAEQKTDFVSGITKMQAGAKSISESTDIEKQREYFNGVTEGVYSLVKSFSVGKPLFYEFCPMANNSNGGYWISESEEINNPYFGDDMLHCGEVKEAIK